MKTKQFTILEEYVELAMRQDRANATDGGQGQQYLQEILQYDILHAMSQSGFLQSSMVFHGGTALKLISGNPRHSEDLDFSGGADYTERNAQEMLECLRDTIGTRYGVDVTGKKRVAPSENISVEKYMFSVDINPDRRDIGKKKIKLEVAAVDALTHTGVFIEPRFDFVPFRTMVSASSVKEILADKLVSLPAAYMSEEKVAEGRGHVRQRDVWDIYHITNTMGVVIDSEVEEMVAEKVRLYAIDDYAERLDNLISNLHTYNTGFADTMRGNLFEVTQKDFKHDIASGNIIRDVVSKLNAVSYIFDEALAPRLAA